MKKINHFSCVCNVRILRDVSGAVAMTYVVLAVLLVAAVVAGVIVFSGVLAGGTETAGLAAGGQLGAAEKAVEATHESHEAASARALASMVVIQGGEFAFSHDSGGIDVGNAKKDEPKRLNEHKVNHPVAVEIGHTVLDLAGLIPGIGDAVDLANAAWYEKDGRHVEAVITAAAAVPVAGTAAVAVKWGNNAAKLAKLVFKDGKLVKVITKEGKVLEKEGGKIAKDAGKGASKETGKTGGDNVVDIAAKRAEKEVPGNSGSVAKKTNGQNVVPMKKTEIIYETKIDATTGRKIQVPVGTREVDYSKTTTIQNSTVNNRVGGFGNGDNKVTPIQSTHNQQSRGYNQQYGTGSNSGSGGGNPFATKTDDNKVVKIDEYKNNPDKIKAETENIQKETEAIKTAEKEVGKTGVGENFDTGRTGGLGTLEDALMKNQQLPVD